MGKKDAKKPFPAHQDKKKPSDRHSGKSDKEPQENKPRNPQRRENKNTSSSAATRLRPAAAKVPQQPNRYEEPVLDDVTGSTQVEVDQHRGVDFSRYLDLNTSQSSSFKLEEEKTWDKDTLDLHGEYFNLDLQNLAAEIAKLPLLERLRVDADLFTDNQLKLHDVPLHPGSLKKNPVSTAEFIINTFKEDARSSETPDLKTAFDDELDSLLTMNVTSFPEAAGATCGFKLHNSIVPAGHVSSRVARDVPSPVTVSSNNDWLDDLLND